MTRFKAGDKFHIDGVDYRVVVGKKAPDDLRLDWWVNGEWRPIRLDHVALIVDQIAENENRLYPPPLQGGAKVINFVLEVYRHGHEVACRRLHGERKNAETRRAS